MSPVLPALFLGCLVLLSGPPPARANGEVHETEYSTSLSEATGVVRVIVAGFGGVIALLGVFVALRGVTAGKPDTATASASLGGGSFKLEGVGQGVVVILLGAAILLGAVYLLPDKRTERTVSGKDVTIERHEGGERLHAAD